MTQRMQRPWVFALAVHVLVAIGMPPVAAAQAGGAATPSALGSLADARAERTAPESSQAHDDRTDAGPGIPELFTGLGRDLRNLVSRDTAQWLAGGAAVSLLVRAGDTVATARLNASPALDVTFESGEVLGGGIVQIGGAAATYLVGRVAASPRIAEVGADLVRAQLVNSVVTQGIKLGVRRARPDGGSYSFPSGHTSSSFATASVLHWHFGWAIGGAAYGFAGYVAVSRLQENRHFLSDVIFGAVVGVVAGRTVTMGREGTRLAVQPAVGRDGAGIVVSVDLGGR